MDTLRLIAIGICILLLVSLIHGAVDPGAAHTARQNAIELTE